MIASIQYRCQVPNRQIRKVIGVPLQQYIKSLLGYGAGYMLVNSDLSIETIVRGTGFAAPKGFSGTFKTFLGVLPFFYAETIKN